MEPRLGDQGKRRHKTSRLAPRRVGNREATSTEKIVPDRDKAILAGKNSAKSADEARDSLAVMATTTDKLKRPAAQCKGITSKVVSAKLCGHKMLSRAVMNQGRAAEVCRSPCSLASAIFLS